MDDNTQQFMTALQGLVAIKILDNLSVALDGVIRVRHTAGLNDEYKEALCINMDAMKSLHISILESMRFLAIAQEMDEEMKDITAGVVSHLDQLIAEVKEES